MSNRYFVLPYKWAMEIIETTKQFIEDDKIGK